MPHILVKTAAGTVNFHYTISTPACTSAKSIDRALPTVLFLHPIYFGQDVFHLQFADPRLRRFNLIALDSRLHGETEGDAPLDFSRVQAANDVVCFLDALNISQCHMFGVSMGCCIGLQVAILYPDRILSLFDVSPLPLEEPIETAEGRQEIFDRWVEGYNDMEMISDEEALADAVYGGMQLAFNNTTSPLIEALKRRILPQGTRNWTPKNFDAFRAVSVGFFVNRQRHSQETLSKIRCPVMLIHCSDDIAYEVIKTKEFQKCLEAAGVDVQLDYVKAVHYGNVTNAERINKCFYEFMLEHVDRNALGPVPTKITSPFLENLVRCGFNPEGDESSEEEFA